MRRNIAALILTAALACAQNLTNSIELQKHPKRSYVCPPNFMRLSHRCYYFSEEALPWQDAYFKCTDLHSNLAIIKNANQDKLIRRTLNKKTLAPLERWLGGRYDWEKMTWKWAASGKPVTYQGFSRMDPHDKENLFWHCIVVDPAHQFKWNSRGCLEKKHFICQTKIKIVTSKGKKKLLKQYHVDTDNKLNEIPVPVLPDYVNNNLDNPAGLKDVSLNAASYATRPKVRKRKTKRTKNKRLQQENNATKQQEMQRRQLVKDDKFDRQQHFKWNTYYKNHTRNPLHPQAIVEEFNFVKDA